MIKTFTYGEEISKEALSYALQDLKILPSGLGDSIGDKAALGVAFNGIFKK